MRSDVASLVLKTVEGLVTQGALIRTRQLCSLILHVIVLHRHRGHHSGEVAVIHAGKSFVILERHRPVKGRRKSRLRQLRLLLLVVVIRMLLLW